MHKRITVGRPGHRLTGELLEQVLVIDSPTGCFSRAGEQEVFAAGLKGSSPLCTGVTTLALTRAEIESLRRFF